MAAASDKANATVSCGMGYVASIYIYNETKSQADNETVGITFNLNKSPTATADSSDNQRYYLYLPEDKIGTLSVRHANTNTMYPIMKLFSAMASGRKVAATDNAGRCTDKKGKYVDSIQSLGY
jgi:hypothetical protein